MIKILQNILMQFFIHNLTKQNGKGQKDQPFSPSQVHDTRDDGEMSRVMPTTVHSWSWISKTSRDYFKLVFMTDKTLRIKGKG